MGAGGGFLPKLKRREEFGGEPQKERKGKMGKRRVKKKGGRKIIVEKGIKGENDLKFVFLLMNIYHAMIRKQTKYIYILKQGNLLSFYIKTWEKSILILKQETILL